ncbi:hypothetical protein RSAG8_10367, partial [Rhizoctonia solani AG-8 WAC10335]
MPSFAGFYATEDECRAWLWANTPEVIKAVPRAGTGAVEIQAREFMRSKRIRDSFNLTRVPLPGPPDPDGPWALMLVRRSSARKEYLAPLRERDYLLRDLVETQFKLKVSDWTVIWYSKHDPELVSEFLSPETVSSDDE